MRIAENTPAPRVSAGAMAQKPAQNIIFSYVPLLRGAPGTAFLGGQAAEAAKSMAAALEDLPSGSAMACIWLVENGTAKAVFAVDRPDEIAEHLKEWAEGRPQDWFSFHYLEKGEAYATALMPDFKKSSERWKAAFQLKYGYPPQAGDESFIFRPLHSVAPSKSAFSKVKPFIGQKVRVGLVGEDEISPNSPIEMEKLRVRDLGEFKAVSEQSGRGMMHGWLENAIDDIRKAMKE